MPSKTRKADTAPATAADAPERALFRRTFVLPAYAADTDCSPAVVTEAIQAGNRPITAPFVVSTEDLPGDRKRVTWAVAV